MSDMFSQTNKPIQCRDAREYKREQRRSNMGNLTGLFVFLLTFLVGQTDGIEPSNGYCIETQCFTVYHHASDFITAQDRCRDMGGHLMTVHSSVSHDILFILLGNLTGRYWVGLHLAAGCPDSSAELRGFQWVTGESESDFFNWPPGLASSCSSPRCVSVSQEDEFQWIDQFFHSEALLSVSISVIDCSLPQVHRQTLDARLTEPKKHTQLFEHTTWAYIHCIF